MRADLTAFFDANVFFGARLRSLVMELAMTGLFRARWSEDVHREWMEAVSSRRGLHISELDRTRKAMDRAVPDCLVTGYEDRIDLYSLSYGDCHRNSATPQPGSTSCCRGTGPNLVPPMLGPLGRTRRSNYAEGIQPIARISSREARTTWTSRFSASL
jgi:hypothetical protein